MKKLFLTLVLAVMGFTAAMADDATTLVATLNHEGALSAYYGKSAFVNAYKAAAQGDVITLSAGRFTGTNIAKEITVRGAGMVREAGTDNGVTVIEGGEMTITLPANSTETYFEGLYIDHTVTIRGSGTKCEITFNKVWVTYRVNTQDDKCVHPHFISCVINSLYMAGGICQNCYIGIPYVNKNGEDHNYFQNCTMAYETYYSCSIQYAMLTNCLFIQTGINEGVYYLGDSNQAKNCVCFNAHGFDESYNFFSIIGDPTNKMVTDRENFFKNSSILKESGTSQYGYANYSIGADNPTIDGHGLYELSDEAKEIYKGNDGTVVGLWGGTTPFSLWPSTARITKCDIVPRVDDDGKLNITIEVAQ